MTSRDMVPLFRSGDHAYAVERGVELTVKKILSDYTPVAPLDAGGGAGVVPEVAKEASCHSATAGARLTSRITSRTSLTQSNFSQWPSSWVWLSR